AIHLPAHHPLGVLHRQTTLGVGDEDDEDHNGQHADDDEEGAPPGQHEGALRGGLHEGGLHAHPHGLDHGRHPGHDTGEEDDGDAVADAELGDLLTQPHDKGGTGGEAEHDDDAGPDD